ncbi:hypothetical protein QOV31_004634 (plasmid) [Agrobacterium fabrum]|nr:hypothetical protein QOV31_004634 [Agrobacterium fabrum]CAD0216727.1 hypothetical protein AGTUEHA105_LOCUS4656 [Agrobacterium tumefaciens]
MLFQRGRVYLCCGLIHSVSNLSDYLINVCFINALNNFG